MSVYNTQNQSATLLSHVSQVENVSQTVPNVGRCLFLDVGRCFFLNLKIRRQSAHNRKTQTNSYLWCDLRLKMSRILLWYFISAKNTFGFAHHRPSIQDDGFWIEGPNAQAKTVLATGNFMLLISKDVSGTLWNMALPTWHSISHTLVSAAMCSQ